MNIRRLKYKHKIVEAWLEDSTLFKDHSNIPHILLKFPKEYQLFEIGGPSKSSICDLNQRNVSYKVLVVCKTSEYSLGKALNGQYKDQYVIINTM